MSKKVTLVTDRVARRLIIPSSFVATINNRKIPMESPIVDFSLAEFRIGKGGWVVQAKATIRASSPEKVDVQFRLTAQANTTIIDAAKASTDNLGYATILAVIGVHVSTNALVKLELTEQGQPAEISGIVITAIRQDNLDILAM
jgi:hypothetical protein